MQVSLKQFSMTLVETENHGTEVHVTLLELPEPVPPAAPARTC